MALSGVLVEAHSYSGGLRYTPYTGGAPRPAWAPPPESVGWRDDFEIEDQDTIIEWHQRLFEGRTVSWLAVFRRSFDAQFGDRRNHAGLGLWLCGWRIVDARSLLLALNKMTDTLARRPDPLELLSDVNRFASDRYLGAYLVPAEKLPRSWAGAPASATTLVDTHYYLSGNRDFDTALDAVGERITRLSLGWQSTEAPRTIVLVTPRNDPPVGRTFAAMEPPGALLADVLEQIPRAFAEERNALRAAEIGLENARTEWESRRAHQQEQLEASRRELEKLDDRPADMEGVAARLNGLSRQIAALQKSLAVPRTLGALPPALPTPSATASAFQGQSRSAARAARPAATSNADPAEVASELSPELGLSLWVLGSGLGAAIVMLAVLAYWIVS